ncbi:MAG: hypothetical protein ACO1SV_12045 [Fimbriimonas sp.]
MADTAFPPHVASERPRLRIRRFAKRLVQVVISYEVVTYALATVQATGLTLPAMVDPAPAANAATCRLRLQHVVEEAARFRSMRADVPLLSLESGVGAAVTRDLPRCPLGGRYELVPSGTSVVTTSGASIVTSSSLLAGRCVGEDGDECHPGVVIASARP